MYLSPYGQLMLNWTPSTDKLMVWPIGDNTSTEVDVGPRIDLVTTLFEEENVGEEDFYRPGLSAPSLCRSLLLSRRDLLCFDLVLSWPEPAEFAKDKEQDQRRDSQILTE
jgi:hypothetical protein